MEQNREIHGAKEYLIGCCHPSKILVMEMGREGRDLPFSTIFCVVGENIPQRQVEKGLKARFPQLPVRLSVYRPGEWSDLVRQEDSQASLFCKLGQVLYEQTWC